MMFASDPMGWPAAAVCIVLAIAGAFTAWALSHAEHRR